MQKTEQVLGWQQLQPVLKLQNYISKSCHYSELQPRIVEAVKHFSHLPNGTILVIRGGDAELHWQTLNQLLGNSVQRAVENIDYIIDNRSGESAPKISLKQTSSNAGFICSNAVVEGRYFDRKTMFGEYYYSHKQQQVTLTQGLIHQVNNGVLILDVEQLLQSPRLWRRLKSIWQTQTFSWLAEDATKERLDSIPSCNIIFKIILLGEIDQLAAFQELEPELYQKVAYSEFSHYVSVRNSKEQQQWADYVNTLATDMSLPLLNLHALNELYANLVRDSENRYRVAFAPDSLLRMLTDIAITGKNHQYIDGDMIKNYFAREHFQHNNWQQATIQDILDNQVIIDTTGGKIGQINGLSVVDYDGIPISFGEPSRISCVVQLGDGELLDIERKNELAGDVHSKATMLVESCLANLLQLPSQLPFSVSLAFEQSYTDIDGDSASLAELCVIVSALAEIEIAQGVAITGSIDQFGRLQTIGGVNLKIEAFFDICNARGLDGKQGVIIPQVSANDLSLDKRVVEAVKAKQFTIWAVKDIFQALELLTGYAWHNDLAEENDIKTRIQLRLEQSEEVGNKRFLKRMFKQLMGKKE